MFKIYIQIIFFESLDLNGEKIIVLHFIQPNRLSRTIGAMKWTNYTRRHKCQI